MVGVRNMRVCMAQRLVVVPMAVRARRHGVVNMVVMPVVMLVCVLMVHRLVAVTMRMVFHQMQHHAQKHEQATACHHHPRRSLSKRKSQQRPDERRKRKYRAGSRGTKSALCQQIKPQTQAISDRSHGQQTQNR